MLRVFWFPVGTILEMVMFNPGLRFIITRM